MIVQKNIVIPAKNRGCHLITDTILQQLPKLPKTGLLSLFLQHTSAGLSINENADPSVQTDLSNSIDQLIPENEPYYTHTYEGPDDMPAHIKSTLVGVSLSLPITNHQLNLGTWQGIYLCEFRNIASNRNIIVTIYS